MVEKNKKNSQRLNFFEKQDIIDYKNMNKDKKMCDWLSNLLLNLRKT